MVSEQSVPALDQGHGATLDDYVDVGPAPEEITWAPMCRSCGKLAPLEQDYLNYSWKEMARARASNHEESTSHTVDLLEISP